MIAELEPVKYMKETREALGLSQQKMGLALGVTAQAVYFWESGRRPPARWVLDWCKTVRVLLDKKPKIPWSVLLTSGGLSSAVLVAFEGYPKLESESPVESQAEEQTHDDPRNLLLDSLKRFLDIPDALLRTSRVFSWMVTPRGTNEISSNHTLLRGATENDLRRGSMVWSPFAALDPDLQQVREDSLSYDKTRHRRTIHVAFESHGYGRRNDGPVPPELEEVYVTIDCLVQDQEQTFFLLGINRETFCCEVVAWVKNDGIVKIEVLPKKLNPPNF